MSLARLQELAQVGINVMMKENWACYYHCITNMENSNLEKSYG
jgi:hypothetical protein